MKHPPIVTEDVFNQVLESLSAPDRAEIELKCWAHEEPDLDAWILAQIVQIQRTLGAWGASVEIRDLILGMTRTHAAAILAAWRLGQRRRWDEISGIGPGDSAEGKGS